MVAVNCTLEEEAPHIPATLDHLAVEAPAHKVGAPAVAVGHTPLVAVVDAEVVSGSLAQVQAQARTPAAVDIQLKEAAAPDCCTHTVAVVVVRNLRLLEAPDNSFPVPLHNTVVEAAAAVAAEEGDIPAAAHQDPDSPLAADTHGHNAAAEAVEAAEEDHSPVPVEVGTLFPK